MAIGDLPEVTAHVIEYGFTKDANGDFVRFVVVEQLVDNNKVHTRYLGNATTDFEDQIVEIDAEIQRKKDFDKFQSKQVSQTSDFPVVETEPSFIDKTKEFFGVDKSKPEFGG